MTGPCGRRLWFAGLVCLLALAGGEVLSAKPTKTITGIVKKHEVYRDKVTSVFISDPVEGKFIVVRGTEKAKELRGRVGETVRATGYVRKAPEGADFPYMIDVLEYEAADPVQQPAPQEGASPPEIEPGG